MPNEKIVLEDINIQEISDKIKQHASESRNEEELKIRIETLLEPIRAKLGIQWASYEHTHKISGVRKDALYGTVIIEYKAPGKLESKREFEKGKEQVKKYIVEEAVEPQFFGRYFGILIDGIKISFIRYRKNEWEEQSEPLEVNARTILRLLEAIRGLKRKPIDAELLLLDFGPTSQLSRDFILTLYKKLEDTDNPRVQMLYEDWRRVFSQVCAYSKEKLVGIIDYYGLSRKDVDVEKLTFALHTYYTILMKLLTSEIVTLFADSLLGSYLRRLEEAYYKEKEEMLSELKDLEGGGLFHQLGIRNFLEADYFAWYLDVWDDEIAKSTFDVLMKLLDYEPATVELNPERVKDLFKRLYQNLVPRDIRHKLGEYFTPDWLAELLLDEVGYYGNPENKILDPACGSGTFLVLAIKRIKDYADEHFLDKRDLIKRIVNNVKGVDLNPLAVLASKANYIINLSDLLRYRPREGIDIPVYLADSILVSRKATYRGDWEVYLNTSEGEFWLPHEVLDKNLLQAILQLIEDCVTNGYKEKDFKELLQRKHSSLNENSIDSIGRLYNKILKLEKMGKNRIWMSLLKNSFAPLLMGKFDFVVGNPPWINWENLPKHYRDSTKDLWNYYGLLEKTKGMGLGKVKRDMAMLFTARCLDRYVIDGGKYSFLIPFTTYKTQAGAGFRKFLVNGKIVNEKRKIPCKTVKVHDLVGLYPFEGAINRTSMIVIMKEWKTKLPINCTMWHNPQNKGVPQELELYEVEKSTKRFDMILTPLENKNHMHPWMIVSEKSYKSIKKITGFSTYKSHEGSNTALSAAYWVNIKSREPNGLLIENSVVSGKKKVKRVKAVIEPNLLYPLVRGREVNKWYFNPSSYIIVPHEDKSGKPLAERAIKSKYDKSHKYFRRFKRDLENRSIHKLLGKGKPYHTIYDLGSYSFYPYKVVWKDITGKISGKQEIISSVISPYQDQFLGKKTPIIDNTLLGIHVQNLDEAHYLCSILNSLPARAFVLSYTHLHVRPYVIEKLNLMRYNKNKPLHKKLANLSKKAHELTKKIYEENRTDLEVEVKKIEDDIDETVAELYGITDRELKEIRNTLMILKEGETLEEEETEEERLIPSQKPIEIKIDPLLIEENKEQEMDVNISNNHDSNIKDINMTITLKETEIASETMKQIKKGESALFEITSPKIKSGQYDMRISMEYKLGRKKEHLEETRTLFVQSKRKKGKKKGKFDEDLDKLLG